MKYINASNLSDYAFVNEDTLARPLRAVCVCFHGYSDATTYEKSPTIARILGEQGIAWVFPYYSVWAWMSRNSREFNEQVLDAAYDRLGADESIPLIVSGGSMGGMTALNYLVYGKRTAIGCALNCAVTDLNRLFTDSPFFRKSILSAHITEEGPLDAVLSRYSPVAFAASLPSIPYYLVYGDADPYFYQTQMPLMVERLEHFGRDYTLLTVPGMAHCDIDSHPSARSAFCNFMVSLVR